MLRKLLFLLGVVVLFSVSALAQQQPSTVYLKNGSIIHGTITEWKPETSITVKTVDGSVILINLSDIDKVSWEAGASPAKPTPIPDNKPFRSKGFSFSIEGAGVFYVSQNANAVPGIYGLVGYHFSPYVCLSIGGGTEVDGGFLATPVYIDCKFFVNNTPNSFLIGLDAGYNHIFFGGSGYEFTYGGMGQLYLGGRYTISKNFALIYGGGYRMQTIYFQDGSDSFLPVASGLLIKIGFLY